ncbi:hypothetical protein BDY24DRAFT_404015, partial [Mrakia frigida]|uniref:uncharacterized protein n=1 Tax=Mrakia frigida TaxID=29902 RepID=UPI003FCBF8C1
MRGRGSRTVGDFTGCVSNPFLPSLLRSPRPASFLLEESSSPLFLSFTYIQHNLTFNSTPNQPPLPPLSGPNASSPLPSPGLPHFHGLRSPRTNSSTGHSRFETLGSSVAGESEGWDGVDEGEHGAAGGDVRRDEMGRVLLALKRVSLSLWL